MHKHFVCIPFSEGAEHYSKFEHIMDLIDKTIDVLIFTEAKLESSFHKQQLKITDYNKPYKLD